MLAATSAFRIKNDYSNETKIVHEEGEEEEEDDDEKEEE